MSKFTKAITRTYNFEGDNVVVVMNRLKRKYALKLIPYMGEPDDDGKVVMEIGKSMEFMDIASDILAKHVTSLSGLVDGDGIAIPIEDVVGDGGASYFMELSTEIMTDLMEASFVKPESEKKLEKQHNDISEGSTTITEKVLKSEE